MKIINKPLKKTADVSSARGATWKEFWNLVLSAVVLMIVLYIIIGVAVDMFVSRISFETEAKIFKHYQTPSMSDASKTHEKDLQKISNILSKLQTQKIVPPLPYKIVIIENKSPNAFAFPGGTIGVTTGLTEALDKEIEIAFVLGHELGHFYNRDHLHGMGRSIGVRVVMSIVFSSGEGAEYFGDVAEFIFQRDYSQKREKRADQFGIELVHAVYGKTEGVDHLFRILLKKHTLPGWAYMFSTHPSPGQRIEDLKAYAARLN